MIDLSVLWLQLAAVAVVNFFVSWVYYSRSAPWFRAWAKGVGFDPDKTEITEAEKKAMPGLMIGALVSSFILSYGLQVLVHSVGAQTFLQGAAIGIVAWLAFSVTHSLNTRFEGRKDVVLVINNGLNLITYAGFAGLLAVWR